MSQRSRDLLVVSNNPLAISILSPHFRVEPLESQSFRDVLLFVRDHIHKGHRLLTHPLSGSIKPNETPYKSIVISRKPDGFSPEDLEMIETAIITFDKFPHDDTPLSDKIHQDFQLVDYTLVAGGLDFDPVAGLQQL
ncbi:MAG: GrdX family protein [Eubacteriales bacterium]